MCHGRCLPVGCPVGRFPGLIVTRGADLPVDLGPSATSKKGPSHVNPSSHRSLALSASGCAAVLVLAGCSFRTPHAHAGNSAPSTPSSSAAATSSSAPRAAAGGKGASGSAEPSTAMTTSAPRTGWLTDKVSGLPTDPVLVFGGQPAKSTVTLRNGSDSTYRDISPLVSIGHCSCRNTGAALALLERLRNWTRPGELALARLRRGRHRHGPSLRASATATVHTGPGATVSFTFRLAISPSRISHPGNTRARPPSTSRS